MKKILVMSIGTQIGGIERSLIEFLKFVVTQDCKVDLYLWQEPGPLFDRIPKEVNIIEKEFYPKSLAEAKSKKGIKKISALFKYILFRITRAFNWPTASFAKFDGEYDIALAFCHNGFSPEYVATKVNAKKKYMFFRHVEYEYDKYPWKHFNKIYQKFDNVVAVSNATREMLKQTFPELKNILVIKNLFDEESIIEKSKVKTETFSSNKCRLCSVGRVSPEKGQKFAVEVAKELSEMNFEYEWIFVGDGEDKEYCIEKTKEYGISNSCKFIGAKENPYPFVKTADIYVQTSFVEGNPGTIQEAKILNKPIIASNIDAIKEVLKEGRFGVTCSLKTKDFATKIIKTYQELLDSNKENIFVGGMPDNAENKQAIKEWLEI